MIRLLFCVLCWMFFALVPAVIGFPALYLTGRIDLLWSLSLWAARMGYTMAGIRVRVAGRKNIEDGRGYLFLSNHTSNLDPPVIANQLGRRLSIIAKKELFRIPLFGRAMRAGDFVCMDRKDRRAAVRAVHDAVRVLQSGLSMMVFPEGTRSRDGRLLPFKKGPFYMAMEAGVPILPITISGTHEAMPKGAMRMRAGEVVVTFHPPLDPRQFATKEELMAAAREIIESALPAQYKNATASPPAN